MLFAVSFARSLIERKMEREKSTVHYGENTIELGSFCVAIRPNVILFGSSLSVSWLARACMCLYCSCVYTVCVSVCLCNRLTVRAFQNIFFIRSFVGSALGIATRIALNGISISLTYFSHSTSFSLSFCLCSWLSVPLSLTLPQCNPNRSWKEAQNIE